jgi:yeast amino acid transporter
MLYARRSVAVTDSIQVGALVCFIIIGIDVFFVMQSLGEMATLYPSAGAFTELAGRFIDGAVAVALGWNYWYLVSQTKTKSDVPC